MVAICPLWVKSRHLQCNTSCPLYTRKRTFGGRGYRYAGRLSTTATALISASMGRLCASVLSVKTHLSSVSCTVMWLCGNFCFNHYAVEIEI